MGGFFSSRETPTQVVSPFPPELRPFLGEFVRAVSNLFANPGEGVSPDELAVLRGITEGAKPVQNLLGTTVSGGFLPGTAGGQSNPFLSALVAGLEREGDVARRQMASAAQRAGALSSTDYLRQASDLEANLAQRRGSLLADLYEQERGRQMGAVPLLGEFGRALLGYAAYPREVATEQRRFPFQVGGNLLSGGRGAVIPGRTEPSPFASLLSGLAPFASLFKITL